MRRKLLGNRDAAVARSLTILASLLETQGKLNEAEAMFREGLAIRRELPATNRADVARSLSHLGQVLGKQEKFAEAEGVRLEALTMLKELLGPQHPEVDAARRNLIWTLSHLRKFAEAEPLMLEIHDCVQQDPQAPATEKRATIERLWQDGQSLGVEEKIDRI